MFEPVEDLHLTKIAVFGVGGAGGNALNHMIQAGVPGVDFYAVNTDLQALHMNLAENKIQIGAQLTSGTGSGGRPETGRKACEENLPLIREILTGYDMVFIAAGEGGGTGTGASPLIAETAREQGSLVVAVVTKPFDFESRTHMLKALEGIDELRPRVDTLIVIPNQKVYELYRNEPFRQAFRLADEVLYNSVKGIAEIAIKPQLVNIDFADVRAVLQEKGGAIMGLGTATGPDRAREAAEHAIYSPLIDDLSIETASRILLSMTGDEQLTLEEIQATATRVLDATHGRADVRFGASHDNSLNGLLRVTVIATGIEDHFAAAGSACELLSFNTQLDERRRKLLAAGGQPTDGGVDKNNLQIPAVLRRHID